MTASQNLNQLKAQNVTEDQQGHHQEETPILMLEMKYCICFWEQKPSVWTILSFIAKKQKLNLDALTGGDTKKKLRRLTHEKIRYCQVQEEVVTLSPQRFVYNKSHDDQCVPGHHNDDQGHHEHRQHHQQVSREHSPCLSHRRSQVAAGVGLQDVSAHH